MKINHLLLQPNSISDSIKNVVDKDIAIMYHSFERLTVVCRIVDKVNIFLIKSTIELYVRKKVSERLDEMNM